MAEDNDSGAYARLQMNCRSCSGFFTPANKSAMYCKKSCKLRAWVAGNPEKHKANREKSRVSAKRKGRTVCPLFASHCKRCQSAFVGRRKRLYCTERCAISKAPSSVDCRTCGSAFKPTYTGGGLGSYCSEPCRQVAFNAGRRVERAKRKAVVRGATVESIDPLRVFERDRWMCQLCGVKTPRTKRGTYEPDAPELDHILPLSVGGAHAYINVQCACRRCNNTKSNRPAGQMLLVG